MERFLVEVARTPAGLFMRENVYKSLLEVFVVVHSCHYGAKSLAFAQPALLELIQSLLDSVPFLRMATETMLSNQSVSSWQHLRNERAHVNTLHEDEALGLDTAGLVLAVRLGLMIGRGMSVSAGMSGSG